MTILHYCTAPNLVNKHKFKQIAKIMLILLMEGELGAQISVIYAWGWVGEWQSVSILVYLSLQTVKYVREGGGGAKYINVSSY